MAIDPKTARSRRQQGAWQDFMGFTGRHAASGWLFRGVPDAVNHKLVPKIGRDPKRYTPLREKVIFANFQRRAQQFVTTSVMTD
jgi:hypothetical protein